MSKSLLLIGCGYIGRRIAKRALANGVEVQGLVRNAAHAEQLSSEGIPCLTANLLDLNDLSRVDISHKRILYAAPPPGGGRSDPKMANFCKVLEHCSVAPQRVVYISTSGIYGDCGGKLVTEDTPPNPQTDRAKRRLDAENRLRLSCKNRRVDVTVLRVTGIYGPDRFPLHRLIEKHPVLLESEARMTNRIHADDLARVCWAALEADQGADILNISDGSPSSMTEYFNTVADNFGLPRPPQVSLAEAKQVMNPLMLSYMLESRDMSNQRMLKRLGINLLYPDMYRGIEASARQMLDQDPSLVERLVSRFGNG